MQQMLIGLGYSHLSSFAKSLTITNFAAQLETYGMWHWAIFAIMHLEDANKRRHAVINVLSHNVQLSEEPDYVNQETFLLDKLGIPVMWINRAKAVKACSMNR